MLMGRKIVLSITAVLMLCGFAVAQNKTVSGTVTATDGNPIVGATVIVDGTTIGTSTDLEGHYTLSAPTNGTLVFSFLGCLDETVAINGKTVVDVVLKEDAHNIDDVIVVAFGEAKREAFTGSAAVLKSDDITKSQSTNAVDALKGKVSGVQIMNASGQPGSSSPTILIRGVSSIQAGTSPLIVVDGMTFAGSISDINPSDIESMSVLKDAAAAALYGARGGNGVILITTKRAKERDAIINVDIKVGVNQRATRDYDYIKDPAKYYETHYAAMYNKYRQNSDDYTAYQKANQNLFGTEGGLGYNVYTLPEGQNLIGRNGKINPAATLGRKVRYDGEYYTLRPDDWTDEVYMNGVRQEYNVSIAAANEKSSFFGSFGYLNNEGIVKATGYERYTARLRADYNAKKWLKVGGNALYTHSYANVSESEGSSNSSGNMFAIIPTIAPIYPLYVRDGNGRIKRDSYGNIIYDYGTSTRAGSNVGLSRPYFANSNAYGSHLLDKHNTISDTAGFDGFADFKLPQGFTVTVKGGTSVSVDNSLSTTNNLYGSGESTGGSIARQTAIYWNYNLQQLITWNRQFDKHNIDVLLGHENSYSRSRALTGSKSNLFSSTSTELPQALKTVSTSSSVSEYNNEGYFIRAQYDYDNRIFASAMYRRDASSRFHPKHRWGNFWAISAGWLINRESWFNASWVDELKLKASYGSQGNDNISNFLYRDSYTMVNDGTDNWAIRFATKGNENITWETNANFNVGAEFGFFGNRLVGSVEYFYRKTSDMLSYYSVPSSLGYSGYWMNVGDMSNQGLEVELNGTVLQKKHVSWDINLNITYVKNKIISLSDNNATDTFYTKSGKGYRGYRDGDTFFGIGLPIYTMLLKSYAGVDKETGEALYYVRNDDGSLSTTTDYSDKASYFLFDTSLPDVYGGFGTSINFYGFDLGVNFVYQIGGKVYDSGYAAAMSSPTSNSSGFALHKDILKSWSPENPTSNLPRFQLDDEYTAASSDRFMTDASYLSLQNINFGYTIPAKLTAKAGISKLRIYLACENVWLWSQRKGLDPRQSFKGGSSTAYYSPIRTISGGINVTF